MIEPIAVSCICDRRIRQARKRRELSVAIVKTRIDDSLRQVFVFAIRTLWKRYALYSFQTAVDYLKIESVPDARLTAWVQVAVIFYLDCARLIEQDAMATQELREEQDASLLTLCGGPSAIVSVGAAIRDNWDIGVDNVTRHSAAFIRRFNRANSASVVSENALPMKSFGQFLIRPNRSTASSVKTDVPSGASQK